MSISKSTYQSFAVSWIWIFHIQSVTEEIISTERHQLSLILAYSYLIARKSYLNLSKKPS